MRRATRLACLAFTLAFCLAGCGQEEKTYEFSEVRELDEGNYKGTPPMSSGERFGFRRGGMQGDPHANMGDPHAGGSRPEPRITWKLPEGWENLPAGGMRMGSWRIQGQEQTDVSLTRLSGTGGGLAANVNRWRGEMGLEPASEAEVAALPKTLLLGGQATYLDLSGNFSGGRGGSGPVEGARMLGLILPVGSTTFFLKFTGPAAVVTDHKDEFETLAASLEVQAPPSEHGAGATPTAAGGYAFDTPEGWALQPAKMMRIATFVPDDMPNGWCYASRLQGDAGGLEANVNRWRREMGQEPLDAAAIAALPTLDVLGTKAPLLDLTGDFAGTGGPKQSGARMYGIICERPDHVVFVKMVGPKDELGAQHDRFVQFCTSLREK